ncbi:MAG TPA: fibronectin type III domain-containing protein [Burkholderiales bacterium]
MPQEKSAVIAGDGAFSFDVAGLKPPYVLRAVGSVEGSKRTLYSIADGPGIANINPLTHAALANAAGVDDPAEVYDARDPALLEKARARMPASVAMLRAKLQPLFDVFNVGVRDPHRQRFVADHDGIDGMLDSVRITLNGGVLTVTNAGTGAVIFTAPVRSFEQAQSAERDDKLPRRAPRLQAPTGVTAVGGPARVTISWNPVPQATSYDLFYMALPNAAARGESDDEDEHEDDEEDGDDTHTVGQDEGRWITNVTSPHLLAGLAPNTTYAFMVRARDNPRRGRPSAKVTATTTDGTPAPSVPAAPSGVSATGGSGQVTVAWNAVAGATSYNLYWSGTNGVTTSNGTRIAGASRPAVLTGLANSATYYFIVTAVNAAGESLASVQVAATTLPPASPPVTPPAAPSGIAATGGSQQVTVSWAAVAGATSYNLYWSSSTCSSGVTTVSGTRIAGVTSPYVHTGLTAGTSYCYVVTAVNSAGESAPSAQAAGTTSPAAPSVPAAPTGVTAVGGTQQVTVSWNPVSGATSYNLYWSGAQGVTTASGTKVTGVVSPYVHAGRADATPYYYIVTAVNGSGESAASGEATAITNAAPPPPIDGAALYSSYCAGCHNPLPGDFAGASAAQITTGIANVGAMRTRFNATSGTLIKLTPEQIAAISAAMQ